MQERTIISEYLSNYFHILNLKSHTMAIRFNLQIISRHKGTFLLSHESKQHWHSHKTSTYLSQGAAPRLCSIHTIQDALGSQSHEIQQTT